MDPTRMGFGRCLAERGDDKRVVCLGADISGSITISQFYEKNPERKDRWISVGIAEQSGTGVCAGLAKEGKLPVFGTYGVFASGRNWDQLRTTVCYGGFNVFMAGAHGGVSVGPDGATHQALEEIFLLCGLPGMNIEVPCDSVETKRASEYLLFEIDGPKYLRFAREATPVVTDDKTPYVFGKANVIRFRGPKDRFKDAFRHTLASKYKSEGEDITIAACGPSVPEAMRAAWILKSEYDIETRVLNVHTLKPLDEDAIVAAAAETGVVVTAEEHQVGGFGNLVAAVISRAAALYGKPVTVGMVGVKDRFGESGAPWELVKEFEVSAEHIALEAKRLYDLKVKKLTAKARRRRSKKACGPAAARRRRHGSRRRRSPSGRPSRGRPAPGSGASGPVGGAHRDVQRALRLGEMLRIAHVPRRAHRAGASHAARARVTEIRANGLPRYDTVAVGPRTESALPSVPHLSTRWSRTTRSAFRIQWTREPVGELLDPLVEFPPRVGDVPPLDEVARVLEADRAVGVLHEKPREEVRGLLASAGGWRGREPPRWARRPSRTPALPADRRSRCPAGRTGIPTGARCRRYAPAGASRRPRSRRAAPRSRARRGRSGRCRRRPRPRTRDRSRRRCGRGRARRRP